MPRSILVGKGVSAPNWVYRSVKAGKTKVKNKIALIAIEAVDVIDQAVKGGPVKTLQYNAAKYAIDQDIGSPASRTTSKEDITITVRTAKPKETS